MPDIPLSDLAAYLNAALRISDVPDYAGALNGVQVTNRGPICGIAAAVDASVRTIEGAKAAGANLLLVHHGLFWGGAQRLDGRLYERIRRLITYDMALYSAHLPLDAHETHGNSYLFARLLGLSPTHGFARYQTIWCGVQGTADLETAELHAKVRSFAHEHGGDVIATPYPKRARTRRWAICTGSGANDDTLREAIAGGVDTLIVGEGPHWSAVEAIDAGITVMYAGHYATETLGVQSIAGDLGQTFGLAWTFVAAPTGL